MVFCGIRARESALDAYDGQVERATADNEQRELYEAAMVIQRAYREYRERNSYRRQAEVECRAAVTIQSCYRRYKQYCYIKQLHSAAIVVQKHFRLKKGNQKEGASINEVQEHPTLEGQILRIQVPQTSSSLAREHRAATTIQTAYRGHRKRQAAARKIQKFMKENRQNVPSHNIIERALAAAQDGGAKRRRFVYCHPATDAWQSFPGTRLAPTYQ